jgi:hypothetical protein
MRTPNFSADMPLCEHCGHKGEHHDWKSPPCSVPRCPHRTKHPKRIRGRCLTPACICTHYVPQTDQSKPLNSFAGRLRRRA